MTLHDPPVTARPRAAARVAALELPALPLQVFVRDRPGLAGRPAVVVEGAAGRERVSAASAEARALGLEPGQPAAEARARVPGLEVLARDVRREWSALVRLAEAALTLAPFVELAPPACLLVDASAAPLVPPEPATPGESLDPVPDTDAGPPPAEPRPVPRDDPRDDPVTRWTLLQGHERAFGRALVETARTLGLVARVAVADTPEAARLLAATAEVPVRTVGPGRARGLLAGVPLGLVAFLCDETRRARLAYEQLLAPGRDAPPAAADAPPPPDADSLTRLLPALGDESFAFAAGLGLRRLGDLATLPARTLPHRLGRDGDRLLALASGGRARPLHPYWPRLPLVETLALETGVAEEAALQFLVRPLVERLALRLERRGVAATRLRLTLTLEAAFLPTLPFAGPGHTPGGRPPEGPGKSSRMGSSEASASIDGDSESRSSVDGVNAGEGRVTGRPRRRQVSWPVDLARPATAPATLVAVVRERLAAWAVTAPVVGLVVEVVESAPRGTQLALGQRPRALEALEGTLSRLTARLGDAAVGTLAPQSAWEPEREARRTAFRPDLGRTLLDGLAAVRRPEPLALPLEPAPGTAPPPEVDVSKSSGIPMENAPLPEPRSDGPGDTGEVSDKVVALFPGGAPALRPRSSPPPASREGPAWRAVPVRPTRVFVPEPVDVEWDGLGRPRTVTFRQRRARVVDWTPPERLSVGWWRGDPGAEEGEGPGTSRAAREGGAGGPSGPVTARDYATWLLDDGVRLWLFRDASASWWAHGVFD